MAYIEIKFEDIVFDKGVRDLCVTRKNGKVVHTCMNYGKSLACPPHSPYLEPVLRKKYSRFFLVWFTFYLDDFAKEMKLFHPEWSDKMCRNARYYNGTIRKGLRIAVTNAIARIRWEHGFDHEFFVLWGGTCRVCKNKKDGGCAITRGKNVCKYPDKRTYSMESVGIDVTETVKCIGMELEWPPWNTVYQVGLICTK